MKYIVKHGTRGKLHPTPAEPFVRLAGKDHPVRLARSLPSVWPVAISEVEAGITVRVMKRIVYAELACALVELQQVQARL